jgi:hypothetical protein
MNQKREKARQLADKLDTINKTLYAGRNADYLEAVAMLRDLAQLPSPIEVRVTAMTDAAKMAAVSTQDPQKRTDCSVGWNAACEAIASMLYRYAAIDARLSLPENDQQAAETA